MAGNASISTRFIVISDTHDFEFGDDPTGPLNTHPLPKADVLLHCGDMTHVGGISAFKNCMKMLSNFDGELKLVIAGSHDLALDRNWRDYDSHPDRACVDEEALQDHTEAMEVMRGGLAKAAGVIYLEEGTHTFTLSNGATFTIYASPYTPEFNGWGFPYSHTENRFDSAAENPIPSFPDVHVIMTHGPPRMILDRCEDGNAGCGKLLQAVHRARPLMHCFGHIHEGYGARRVSWVGEGDLASSGETAPQGNRCPQQNSWPIEFGTQTLMVNAAIKDGGNRPRNAPWLIDLDLPPWRRESNRSQNHHCGVGNKNMNHMDH
ncbi:hypothetical protein PVAG01_05464 [Phlyctema vagabunda]|uniref:Calcineurin-like phosphoesterase domain-containing protein n=1 Tax=Phlyctema vagabunda TaxID=108571 RepID=A0ABR4PK36_9HELO